MTQSCLHIPLFWLLYKTWVPMIFNPLKGSLKTTLDKEHLAGVLLSSAPSFTITVSSLDASFALDSHTNPKVNNQSICKYLKYLVDILIECYYYYYYYYSFLLSIWWYIYATAPKAHHSCKWNQYFAYQTLQTYYYQRKEVTTNNNHCYYYYFWCHHVNHLPNWLSILCFYWCMFAFPGHITNYLRCLQSPITLGGMFKGI